MTDLSPREHKRIMLLRATDGMTLTSSDQALFTWASAMLDEPTVERLADLILRARASGPRP